MSQQIFLQTFFQRPEKDVFVHFTFQQNLNIAEIVFSGGL